jgi:hypothetical protein
VRVTVPENGDIRTIDTSTSEVSHCAVPQLPERCSFPRALESRRLAARQAAANFEASRVAKSALAEFATSSVRVLFGIVGLRRG